MPEDDDPSVPEPVFGSWVGGVTTGTTGVLVGGTAVFVGDEVADGTTSGVLVTTGVSVGVADGDSVPVGVFVGTSVGVSVDTSVGVLDGTTAVSVGGTGVSVAGCVGYGVSVGGTGVWVEYTGVFVGTSPQGPKESDFSFETSTTPILMVFASAGTPATMLMVNGYTVWPVAKVTVAC